MEWLSTLAIEPNATTTATLSPTQGFWLGLATVIATIVVAAMPSIRNRRVEAKNPPGAEPGITPKPPIPPVAPIVAPDGRLNTEATVTNMLAAVKVIQDRQEASDAENAQLRQKVYQLELRLQYATDQHHQNLQQIVSWAEHSVATPVPKWIHDMVASAKKVAAR